MTDGVEQADAPRRRAPHAWVADRAAVVVVAVTAVAYSALWGVHTRLGDDTDSYRDTAATLFHGWHRLTDRTPGYPAMLWLLGAGHHNSTPLFLVQMAMHAAVVLMVVGVARRIGVPRNWRLALAVFLVLPPAEVKVVLIMTEAVTEFLLTLALWMFVRWYFDRRWPPLLGLGAALALAAMVRPTFSLLFVPVGVFVVVLGRQRRGPSRLAAAAAVTLPSIVLVGALTLSNGIRFDSPGLTPLLPWHLSSRVAPFVERLPRSDEPARSILIRTRDHLLLTDPNHEPKAFAFSAQNQLAAAVHKTGPALDRYLLGLDLKLIVHHPFDYLDSVEDGGRRYLQFDSEPVLPTGPRVVGYLYNAAQPLLVLLFAFQASVVVGLAWLRRLDRTHGAVLMFCALVSLYCAAVSAGVEVGSARLRAPTDPMLALFLVSGLWLAWQARRSADPTVPPPATGASPAG